MAKYNAAKHRIESDDGRVLATLTEHVETSQAWGIADSWGEPLEEISYELFEETVESEEDLKDKVLHLEMRMVRWREQLEDIVAEIAGEQDPHLDEEVEDAAEAAEADAEAEKGAPDA
jgi:hypothetical protein